MSSWLCWYCPSLQDLIRSIGNSVSVVLALGLIENDVIVVRKQVQNIPVGIRFINREPGEPIQRILPFENDILRLLPGQKSQPRVVHDLPLESKLESQLPAAHNQITRLGILLEIVGGFQVAGAVVIVRNPADYDSQMQE